MMEEKKLGNKSNDGLGAFKNALAPPFLDTGSGRRDDYRVRLYQGGGDSSDRGDSERDDSIAPAEEDSPPLSTSSYHDNTRPHIAIRRSRTLDACLVTKSEHTRRPSSGIRRRSGVTKDRQTPPRRVQSDRRPRRQTDAHGALRRTSSAIRQSDRSPQRDSDVHAALKRTSSGTTQSDRRPRGEVDAQYALRRTASGRTRTRNAHCNLEQKNAEPTPSARKSYRIDNGERCRRRRSEREQKRSSIIKTKAAVDPNDLVKRRPRRTRSLREESPVHTTPARERSLDSDERAKTEEQPIPSSGSHSRPRHTRRNSYRSLVSHQLVQVFDKVSADFQDSASEEDEEDAEAFFADFSQWDEKQSEPSTNNTSEVVTSEPASQEPPAAASTNPAAASLLLGVPAARGIMAATLSSVASSTTHMAASSLTMASTAASTTAQTTFHLASTAATSAVASTGKLGLEVTGKMVEAVKGTGKVGLDVFDMGLEAMRDRGNVLVGTVGHKSAGYAAESGGVGVTPLAA